MKVEFLIKEEEYQGYKYKSLYILLNGVEYRIGTLKESGENKWVQSISKKNR